MPNIEIHGYLQSHKLLSEEICQKIIKGLKNTPIANEVVITVHHTECLDLDGSISPFFRVLYTEDDPIDTVIAFLHQTFDMGIELQPLAKFIKARSES